MTRLEQDVIDAVSACVSDSSEDERDSSFASAHGSIAILKNNLSGEPLERALRMLCDSYTRSGLV